MHLWHKWSKWVQYENWYKVENFFSKKVYDRVQIRQKRTCEKCGLMQDAKVTE